MKLKTGIIICYRPVTGKTVVRHVPVCWHNMLSNIRTMQNMWYNENLKTKKQKCIIIHRVCRGKSPKGLPPFPPRRCFWPDCEHMSPEDPGDDLEHETCENDVRSKSDLCVRTTNDLSQIARRRKQHPF